MVATPNNLATSFRRPATRLSVLFTVIGAVLLLLLASCSEDNNGQTANGTGGALDIPGQVTAGDSPIVGTGGSGSPMNTGTGGAIAIIDQPSTGGTNTPPAGGTGGINLPTGGTTPPPPTGGTIEPPTGGATPPPAGGTGGEQPVTGGAGGAEPPPGECGPLVECSVDTATLPDHVGEICGSFRSVDELPGQPSNQPVIQMGPYASTGLHNVGQDFAIPLNPLEVGCDLFAAAFGEDPALTQKFLDLKDVDLTLHMVVAPGCPKPGEKYPLIVWGNGTCAQPGSYLPLLSYTSSYGYIVVAPHNRYVAGGAMTTGLEFMISENDRPDSPWYQMVDTDKIGGMGHSQGGLATAGFAADPRVDSVILWNGGDTAVKPFLAVSGDADIMGATPMSMAAAVNAAPKGAWLFYHQVPITGNMSGHLTLILEPERVVEPCVKWWDLILKEDPAARDYFVGPNCTLCNRAAEFEFGQKGL